MFGLIEAGGTKFVCAVASSADDIRDRTVFPTGHPQDTLKSVVDYLKAAATKHGPLKGIGLACFGPIDLDRSSPSFGSILNTPKPGWSGFGIERHLSAALGVPVEVDTDVNCALLAEARYGAGKGLSDLVYITVGTGIGAGIMEAGNLVYGVRHPEVGHMFAPRQADDDFAGVCPYHGDQCFEGLASGPAISARWAATPAQLPPDHAAWDLEARYLALLCLNLTVAVAPARIIVGGGVMGQPEVLPGVQRHFVSFKNGYDGLGEAANDASTFIAAARLAPDAGLVGALEIVQHTAQGRCR